MASKMRTGLQVLLLVLVIGVMILTAATLPLVRCKACDGDGSNVEWGHKDFAYCGDCSGWGRRGLWTLLMR